MTDSFTANKYTRIYLVYHSVRTTQRTCGRANERDFEEAELMMIREADLGIGGVEGGPDVFFFFLWC